LSDSKVMARSSQDNAYSEHQTALEKNSKGSKGQPLIDNKLGKKNKNKSESKLGLNPPSLARF